MVLELMQLMQEFKSKVQKACEIKTTQSLVKVKIKSLNVLRLRIGHKENQVTLSVRTTRGKLVHCLV